MSPQSVPRGFCERKIKFTQALCLLTYSSSNLFILSINQKSTYDFHRNSKANVNTFCHPYTCTIITHLNENLDQGRTEEFGWHLHKSKPFFFLQILIKDWNITNNLYNKLHQLTWVPWPWPRSITVIITVLVYCGCITLPRKTLISH